MIESEYGEAEKFGAGGWGGMTFYVETGAVSDHNVTSQEVNRTRQLYGDICFSAQQTNSSRPTYSGATVVPL